MQKCNVGATLVSWSPFLFMTYSEKLKDPRWQKKRLKIMERDNFTCVICTDQQTTLHIHHMKYSGNPWDAPDSDLITVCKFCHHFITFIKGKEEGIWGNGAVKITYKSGDVFCLYKVGDYSVAVTFKKDTNSYLSFWIDQEDCLEIARILKTSEA